MKRTITAPLFAFTYPSNPFNPEWIDMEVAVNVLFSTSGSTMGGYVKVGTGTVTLTLDDTTEIVSTQIATLQEEAKYILAEAADKANAIEDKIRNLQALTCEAAA